MPRSRTVSDEAILDAVRVLALRIGPARLTFAAAAAEVGLSAATLVQRFGTKRDLLLAADKRSIDVWVGALDRSTAASPLARVVEGLVLAVDDVTTPELMANAVAMLQLDLADPDFHAETLRGARAVRSHIERALTTALDAGELRAGTNVAMLATLVETTYHGAMVGWAIHREGALADWMREQLEATLAAHRAAPVVPRSGQS
jgi:AcrR family transcriptional regulator